MVQSGLLTEREAIMKLDTTQLTYFLDKQIDPNYTEKLEIIGTGKPGGYGVASGHIVLSTEMAEEITMKGGKAIFCLSDTKTSQDDIMAIKLSSGVISLLGDMHSDVAKLCRGLGIPCVTGLRDLDCISRSEILTEEKDGNTN
jgi:pyruvate,orthophosphate dikinase